tara:strand:- start:25105 stop:25809 length:705 start_codon:yes stop_codon:yes gene_type:complete
MFIETLAFAFIPFLFMILGGIQVFIKKPSGRFNSMIQHFAAGLIFSTVAIELVPKILGQSKELLLFGFILGVMTMMFSEHVSHNLPKKIKSAEGLPLAFLIAIGLDIFIDGMLIGATFLSDSRSGMLVAMAIAFEVLILGIAVNIKLLRNCDSRLTIMNILIGLASFIPIGAIIGYGALSFLPHSVHVFILSFSTVALLYLVTEELLIDAHKHHYETEYDIIFFFMGFVLVFLL